MRSLGLTALAVGAVLAFNLLVAQYAGPVVVVTLLATLPPLMGVLAR